MFSLKASAIVIYSVATAEKAYVESKELVVYKSTVAHPKDHGPEPKISLEVN